MSPVAPVLHRELEPRPEPPAGSRRTLARRGAEWSVRLVLGLLLSLAFWAGLAAVARAEDGSPAPEAVPVAAPTDDGSPISSTDHSYDSDGTADTGADPPPEAPAPPEPSDDGTAERQKGAPGDPAGKSKPPRDGDIDEPATGGVEEPATEEPPTEEPSGEEPVAEEPSAEEPAEEQPAEEQPAEEQPAEEQPARQQPSKEKTAEEPAEEPADCILSADTSTCPSSEPAPAPTDSSGEPGGEVVVDEDLAEVPATDPVAVVLPEEVPVEEAAVAEVPEVACSEVLAPPSSTSLLDLLAEPVDCGASALLDVAGALVETPLDASTFCLTGRDYSASTALLLTAPTGEGQLSPVAPPAVVDLSGNDAAPAEDTVTGSRHVPFSGSTETPTQVPAVPVPPTAAGAHGGCGGAGPRRDDTHRGSVESAVLPAAIPALAPPPVELRPAPTEVAPIVPRAEHPGVRPD